MTLEINLDTATVYKISVPVCRALRGSAASQGQASRIEFRFRPWRATVWNGYRDTDDTTRAGETVEANVWLAGADPDAMILGLAFMVPDRILMNTVHIARPRRADSTVVAPGVLVRTYPTPERR